MVGGSESYELHNLRVLVVEDEPLIASMLEDTLGDNGAEVIGPFCTVKDTMAALSRDERIDAAILDIKLCDGACFEIVDELRRIRVPFVFATGYGPKAIPTKYRSVQT